MPLKNLQGNVWKFYAYKSIKRMQSNIREYGYQHCLSSFRSEPEVVLANHTKFAKGEMLMSRLIWMIGEFTVKEGQLDTVKTLLKTCIETVKAKDRRVLSYQFFFNDDESKLYIIECYEDSEAVLAHVEIIGDLFFKLIEVAPMTRGEIFGNASDELVQALAPSGPQFFKYWGGFTR